MAAAAEPLTAIELEGVVSFTPATTLTATFPSGLTLSSKSYDDATPAKTSELPKIQINEKTADLYTVILSDPDAPSTTDHKFGEWLHYRVVNCPVEEDGTISLEKGDDTVEYVGPAPGDGSGKHRYTLVVYAQSEKIEDDGEHITATSGFPPRRSFNSAEYAEKQKLKPVAGTRFLAAFDESVPGAHKKLKGEA